MCKSCLEYKNNVHSRNGNDGIIEFIFDQLNIKNGSFIDFGAGNCELYSNSFSLVQKGWTGLMIENNSKKFVKLMNLYESFNNITFLRELVSYYDDCNLDTIIESIGYHNKGFDFISINVGGLEYNIFKSIKKIYQKFFV